MTSKRPAYSVAYAYVGAPPCRCTGQQDVSTASSVVPKLPYSVKGDVDDELGSSNVSTMRYWMPPVRTDEPLFDDRG
ncbi:hypothetical protein ACFYO1_25855 [Nocardia sp. NPDC006044]|uniref:hypothetical protein n=1 Tax=Nocardia sp. NPDC006044 TaxID=3364306 RepID=UPI003692F404